MTVDRSVKQYTDESLPVLLEKLGNLLFSRKWSPWLCNQTDKETDRQTYLLQYFTPVLGQGNQFTLHCYFLSLIYWYKIQRAVKSLCVCVYWYRDVYWYIEGQKESWIEVVEKDCRVQQLRNEDAVDCTKWIE